MAFESNIDVSSIWGDTDAMPRAPRGMGSGFAAKAETTGFSLYDGPVFPRTDWDELMDLQDKNLSSPYDTHKAHVEIKNQKSTNYCWSFGMCTVVETEYAMAGMHNIGLSPAAVACQAKDFQNVGGWGEDAAKQIVKTGIPTYKTWKNVSFDRSLPNNPAVIKDSARHNILSFSEFDRGSFDEVVSCLISPYGAKPVTGGYNHWRHLITLLKAVKVDGQIGVLFANSWGSDWSNDGGYGILLGGKAIADEAVSVSGIKPRSK